jgi:hypothetical protein
MKRQSRCSTQATRRMNLSATQWGWSASRQRAGTRNAAACWHCAPADARILDPMAELIIDDEDLVVHLTLGEKIWGFHGDIRVRLSSIVSAAPDPKPWLGLRGWRMAGVSFAGHAVLGTRRHGDGYDFCILHRDRPAVRVDVASGRFSRLVICVPEGGDPEAEAARIAAAAGIAPSAPVS